jgi:phosphoesterase RecJ-like protein
MPVDWARFVPLVERGSKFLLTSHARPDCDALGSELGLTALLESLGKHVRIVNGDPVPEHLAFIDPERRIKVLGVDHHADAMPPFDTMIVVDTSAWVQLGAMAEVWRRATTAKAVIDHHISEDDLGGEVFKDVEAESTGRLILEAAEALGVTITEEIARPLFAALATDTGWFRFSSVTPETLRAAARLVEGGADPATLYAQLYEQNTLPRLRLRGRILSRAESHCEGRLLLAEARSHDFKSTGARPSDTEDVVNMLLSVAGSEAAVLLQQYGRGRIKASLRSHSRLDVRRVAERFGGGGHTAAAGVVLAGPMARAKATILDALREAME